MVNLAFTVFFFQKQYINITIKEKVLYFVIILGTDWTGSALDWAKVKGNYNEVQKAIQRGKGNEKFMQKLRQNFKFKLLSFNYKLQFNTLLKICHVNTHYFVCFALTTKML